MRTVPGSGRVGHIEVALLGAVRQTVPPTGAPWELLDECGRAIVPVNRWLEELAVSDYSPSTIKAYAYDLLNWFRFLDAVQVPWTMATRNEVRDWVLWNKQRPNSQRSRTAASGRPDAGEVNARTGKRYLQVDPGQADRLNDIRSSLSAQVDEAERNHWLGDVDQLRRTIAHADRKAEQLQRITGQPALEN